MPRASSLLLLEAAPARRRAEARDLTLPVAVVLIGFIYFLWVALLATAVVARTGLEPTIEVEDWVAGGGVLMVVLLVVLVLDARTADRRRTRRARRRRRRAAPAYAPEDHARPWDRDEIMVTAETWQGLRVLEYSRPPKSEMDTALYAKTHVRVDGQYVLRVSDLVAQANE